MADKYPRNNLSDDLTRDQYLHEIRIVAKEILEEALDYCGEIDSAENHIYDTYLDEVVEGHRYIIYYHFQPFVLAYTSNASAFEDEMGLSDLVLGGEDSTNDVIQRLAWWAFRADVAEHLEMLLDERREVASV